MSARLAVMQAIQRLAAEADVHLQVKSFEVKNAVGAVTLGATINCEEFAQTHTDTVHYDRSSFVGMVRSVLLVSPLLRTASGVTDSNRLCVVDVATSRLSRVR